MPFIYLKYTYYTHTNQKHAAHLILPLYSDIINITIMHNEAALSLLY